MNRFSKLFVLGLTLALVLALGIPAVAQDRTAGEGAPLILPNFGADIATLNPILANDGTSTTITTRIYPGFIGVDNDLGLLAPGMPGSLVTDWTISEDGLTYTFTLRDDYVWSDGTPVTSADVMYVWDAMNTEGVNINGNLQDLLAKVTSMEAPDANTVVITFLNPDCNAVDTAAVLTPVPAHVYSELFPNFVEMNEAPENLNPTVTSGAWNFLNFRPGEQVTLGANANYPDDVVVPEGWIYKTVADQTVQTEQFLNNQLTYMGVPNARQTEFAEYVEAGTYLGHFSPRVNMRFLAFNLGDPTNPVPGLDADGNPIDQGLHPVFGDVRVRQALNYAYDFNQVNEAILLGYGFQPATHSRPDDWAYPADLAPYPFDLDMANQLLEEAGWVDTDGDGVRECRGCLYATEVDPSFEGSPLTFRLETNAGNTSQEQLGILLQDMWRQVGVNAEFQPIDFNVLVDSLTGQTFDALFIFWGFGFPFDPDGMAVTFGAINDEPGAGFNGGSYYNARFEELVAEARALPGCDIDARRTLYQEAYTILHEDSPWMWLALQEALVVAQPNVEGWSPKPTASSEALWNDVSWYVAP